jgi:ABC-type glycerol-3-phosphate transport system permease component
MIALIYLVLAIGGIGMIFPFLLMLRLSTSDATDDNSLQIAPSYWWDKDSLAKKYLLKRYYGLSQNPFSPEVQPALGPMPDRGTEWTVSNFATLPNFWSAYFSQYEQEPVDGQRKQIADYRDFLTSLPPMDYITVDWDPSPDFLSFRQFLRRRLQLPVYTSRLRYLVRPDCSVRDWKPHRDDSFRLSLVYKDWAKPQFKRPLYPNWVNFLKAKYGQFDTSKLNAAYGSRFKSWTEVRFPLTEPTGKSEKADYREFVLKDFPHAWTRIKGDHQAEWRQFMAQDQKIRTPADWRQLTGLSVPAVDAIPFNATRPDNEAWAQLWSKFVDQKIGVEQRELRSPDRIYVERLKRKYATLDRLNQAWGTHLTDWDQVTYAEGLSDYRAMVDDRTAIKSALTFQPYAVSLDYLTEQSHSILNTAFLIVMALVAALTVNPLAAYSLSRFRIRGSHRILLFFLATMALPAEIAMVPSFLLVRNLGLMNNYLALILPTAASAFGIFLLKGFFDSLPAELYEAATLDGAKELTIFTRITIPLAKPILAVTSLGAVLTAYGTFIPPILYLQNQDLWPLMPRIFVLTTAQHDVEFTFGVNMATLVLTSLPTLLIFLFAQRLIMRGIIIPTFK